MQPLRLADHARMAVVGLPSVGARALEMAQVVEALVGAPAEHAAGVVEGGRPVHESVGAERAGGTVLQARVLPVRHPFDYAGPSWGMLSDLDQGTVLPIIRQ